MISFRSILVLAIAIASVHAAEETLDAFYEVAKQECHDITCIRREMDRINVQILRLLTERTAYVKRAGDLKSQTTKIADDRARVRDQEKKIIDASIELGLPTEISLPTFRALMETSIQFQQGYIDQLGTAAEGKESEVWKNLHTSYQKQDWTDRPSLFAEAVSPYLPATGKILELGAGLGQDSNFFVKAGYEVVCTDIETTSLVDSLSNIVDEHKKRITVDRVDLREPLPYENGSFDVVYAHLSLHYFGREMTQKIVNEIERVLKPGGLFAFITNSIHDPEYRTGLELEPDFFQIGKVTKRYFSLDYTRQLTSNFLPCLIDDRGETYKDRAKGIHHLIRFIGHRP